MNNRLLLIVILSIVSVCSVSAQDTIQVYMGWNNIGSLESGIAPADLVTFPPGIVITSMYEYNPGAGYTSSDTLEKGRGYWVKVNADGIIIFNPSPPPDPCGIKQVSYGGRIYHTVSIAPQCWLKENLDIGVMIDSLQDASNNGAIEKYCHQNDTANCTLYGGLYQWGEAMGYSATPGTQGICPPGWHIPTGADFTTLSSAVLGNGNKLKSVGQGSGVGAGTNGSGFSGLLVGLRDVDLGFIGFGSGAYFWSSAEYDETTAVDMGLNSNDSDISIEQSLKNFGFSVRCLED
jgi:uncharacterized protein (TIGR02145 family)